VDFKNIMDFKNEGKRRHEKTSELLLDVERQQHKKSGIAFLRNSWLYLPWT